MIPSELILHRVSASLEIVYDDNRFVLPAAYLRARSPSAENKMEANPIYKPDVKLEKAEAVGNYALRLYFDDGHQTGIYSWPYLRQLCRIMQSEMAKLQAKPAETPETQVLHIQPPSNK